MTNAAGRLDPLLQRQVDDVVAAVDQVLPEKMFVSVGEVAAALGTSTDTVRRRVHDRFLTSILVGGRRLIPRAAVIAYVRANTAPAYPTASDYDDD